MSPTIKVWGFSELDLLLTQYVEATHTALDVSEDMMMEEIAASLAVCRMAAGDLLGILAQTGNGLCSMYCQAQVTPL